MNNQYEAFKKYQVEAESVEGFLERYTKRDRHSARGKEYVQTRIESHQKDMEKYGFTFITHHDSVTGDVVAFYK